MFLSSMEFIETPTVTLEYTMTDNALDGIALVVSCTNNTNSSC